MGPLSGTVHATFASSKTRAIGKIDSRRLLQLQAEVGAPLQKLHTAGINWSRPLLLTIFHNFRLEVYLRQVPQG
jgi:hypothetical protein